MEVQVTSETSVKNNAQRSQQQVRVDEILMKSSQHYEILFRTVLTIIEAMAFQKLKPLTELQMKNGVKFGSTDKCDAKALLMFC